MDAETSRFIDNIVDRRIIVAFDLFGTLLSTDSISKKLAEYYPDKSGAISTAWRKYQLEYTWRLNSMGTFEPFDTITRKSLLHALSESSIPHDESQISQILTSYASLTPFPDVPTCLETIISTKHLQPIIFTNGTSKMAKTAVINTPELQSFGKVRERDAILSADEIEKYKPHPMIYQYLAAKVGKSITVGDRHGGIDEVVLVSANPFDIVGGQAVGMTGVWVDRAGNGWHDALAEDGPKVVIRSLEELKGVLEGILEAKGIVWEKVTQETKEES
ncbi:hypothetical protein TWF970_009167 [Orbilia oligospora]|uniref:Haloacid dehalogenase, type II n=1 Tax=Orbilia oligospora TaxID=2813651 RepID=A0A7C8R5N1_ORBOL|nr:hypothetical protein TWF970_009167 [Orbilia oligospora]